LVLVVSRWLWQQNCCKNNIAEAPNSHSNLPMTAPNNYGNNFKEQQPQQCNNWGNAVMDTAQQLQKQMTTAMQ